VEYSIAITEKDERKKGGFFPRRSFAGDNDYFAITATPKVPVLMSRKMGDARMGEISERNGK